MLSYTEVTGADPAALTALAKTWRGVADTHTNAAGRLNTQAVEKLWGGTLDGHSIRAAHGRGGELHTQIKAGATEADDLAGYVEDFAGTVGDLQAELATLVSQAGHAGMDVSAAGVVSVPAATLEVLRDSGHLDLQGTALRSAEDFNTRIKQVLKRATEADTAFERNLRLVAELDRDGDVDFNADGRHDIEVTARAERAADLLRGGGDRKLSAQEVARANALLAKHGGDDVFATALMNELGPEGLMRQAGSISARLGPDAGSGTDELVRRLYDNLGETLATATEDSNERHVDADWVAEFQRQGARTFSVGPNGVEVPGYTLISPAFTSGHYDPDFIAPVAAHMMALDGRTDWNADWNPAFDDGGRPGVYQPLDPVRQSPINAALIAVDNNPAAATELFSHGPGDEYGFENADGQTVDIDPLDYVLRTAQDPATDTGIDANIAGNAIEAATTGMSSDNDPTDLANPPAHTPEMVDIAQRTIEFVGQNPEDFAADGARANDMVDNFADIGSNYMSDVHHSFMTAEDSAQFPRRDEAHLDFGQLEPKGQHDLRQFLQVVGQDGTAGAQLWGASKATAYLNAEYAAQHATDLNLHTELSDAVLPHGHLTAELVNGKFESIEQGHWKPVQNLDVINKGVNMALGPASSPMTPLPANVLGLTVSMGGDFVVGAAESEAEQNTWRDQKTVYDEQEKHFLRETRYLVDQVLTDTGRGDGGSVREIAEIADLGYNGKLRPDLDAEGREFGGR